MYALLDFSPSYMLLYYMVSHRVARLATEGWNVSLANIWIFLWILDLTAAITGAWFVNHDKCNSRLVFCSNGSFGNVHNFLSVQLVNRKKKQLFFFIEKKHVAWFHLNWLAFFVIKPQPGIFWHIIHSGIWITLY